MSETAVSPERDLDGSLDPPRCGKSRSTSETAVSPERDLDHKIGKHILCFPSVGNGREP